MAQETITVVQYLQTRTSQENSQLIFSNTPPFPFPLISFSSSKVPLPPQLTSFSSIIKTIPSYITKHLELDQNQAQPTNGNISNIHGVYYIYILQCWIELDKLDKCSWCLTPGASCPGSNPGSNPGEALTLSQAPLRSLDYAL